MALLRLSGNARRSCPSRCNRSNNLVDEWPGRSVVAVVLQSLEARMSLFVEDNDLAVEHGLVLQFLQGSGDRPIALREGQAVARIQVTWPMSTGSALILPK